MSRQAITRVAGEPVPGAGGADPRFLTQLLEEEVPDELTPQVPVLFDVLSAIGVTQALSLIHI